MSNYGGDWVEVLQLCGIGCVCGLAGGIVRLVRFGAHSFISILANLVISGFCGTVTFIGLYDMQYLTLLQKVALSCVLGNSGAMVLDAVQSRILRRVRGECQTRADERADARAARKEDGNAKIDA